MVFHYDKIVEQGVNEELIKRGNIYRKLFELQWFK